MYDILTSEDMSKFKIQYLSHINILKCYIRYYILFVSFAASVGYQILINKHI